MQRASSIALTTDAALVHPGHKSLNWLTPRERENGIKQFKEELLNIAGVDTEPLDTNMEVMEHSSVPTTQIPLDSYFDFEASQFHCFVQIYSSFFSVRAYRLLKVTRIKAKEKRCWMNSKDICKSQLPIGGSTMSWSGGVTIKSSSHALP